MHEKYRLCFQRQLYLHKKYQNTMEFYFFFACVKNNFISIQTSMNEIYIYWHQEHAQNLKEITPDIINLNKKMISSSINAILKFNNAGKIKLGFTCG